MEQGRVVRWCGCALTRALALVADRVPSHVESKDGSQSGSAS
jgi:hypothetical protein